MSKTVRGYLRGLEILQALSKRRIATAVELTEDTNLPRPTVYRMLGTLVEAGYANQVGGSQYYALSSKVQGLSDGYDDMCHALEVAEPWVNDLSKRINWPCYLHSVEDDVVVTRLVVRSPRELGAPKLGGRLPLAHFSAGRLHLASLDDAELAARVETFDEAQSGGYAEGLTPSLLRALVLQAREHGFGFRDGGVVPRTCSFAVPVRKNGRPTLYLTTNFMQAATPLSRAVDTYMPIVMETVSAIEAGLAETPLAEEPPAALHQSA